MVQAIYETTAEDAGARLLMAELALEFYEMGDSRNLVTGADRDHGNEEEDQKRLPYHFVTVLLFAMVSERENRVRTKATTHAGSCRYHDHGEEGPCYRKR